MSTLPAIGADNQLSDLTLASYEPQASTTPETFTETVFTRSGSDDLNATYASRFGIETASGYRANLEARSARANASEFRLDPVSEARLARVNPVLANRVRQMAADLARQGIRIVVAEGFRSFERQNELYAQGRTKPGPRVTNVRGGHSFHNYGLAVDIYPANANGQPNFNSSMDVLRKIGAAGTRAGLEWGGNWQGFKDYPHFQLTGGRRDAGAYLDLYRRGGLSAVWAEVNRHYPANGETLRPTTTTAPTNNATSLSAPNAYLRRGSRGAEVRQLQAALVRLRYMTQAEMDTGPGIFGPRTFDAVQEFQRAHGLEPDGIYGRRTRAALAQALSRPSSTSPIDNATPPVSGSAVARVNQILRGTGLAGKGALMLSLARRYNVPVELALAMFRKEAQFNSAGYAPRNNNPGNIRFVGQRGAVRGEGGFARWNSLDEGIEAYFRLLGGPAYRNFIDRQDWQGLVNKYAPPSENDSGLYFRQINQWMRQYRRQINGS